MKSYKQFISEAREAKAFLAGDLPIIKRKKKKVGQKVDSKRSPMTSPPEGMHLM